MRINFTASFVGYDPEQKEFDGIYSFTVSDSLRGSPFINTHIEKYLFNDVFFGDLDQFDTTYEFPDGKPKYFSIDVDKHIEELYISNEKQELWFSSKHFQDDLKIISELDITESSFQKLGNILLPRGYGRSFLNEHLSFWSKQDYKPYIDDLKNTSSWYTWFNQINEKNYHIWVDILPTSIELDTNVNFSWMTNIMSQCLLNNEDNLYINIKNIICDKYPAQSKDVIEALTYMVNLYDLKLKTHYSNHELIDIRNIYETSKNNSIDIKKGLDFTF